MKKHRYRRGYPIATLLGLEVDHAILWDIFSNVVKKTQKINLKTRIDAKTLYNFHEKILKKLKKTIQKGNRTIVIATPSKTTFASDFMKHIKKHHKYLIHSKNLNKANFAEITGSAKDHIKVREIVTTKEFKKLILETTNKEADQIIQKLEKYLNSKTDSSILYSLNEIEDEIYTLSKDKKTKIKYLIITNKYLKNNRHKTRIHRLLQIAKNKKIKTSVLDSETAAGARVTQFGGILFFSN